MLTPRSPATQQVEGTLNRGMKRAMVSYLGIALGTALAAAIRAGYKQMTGKEFGRPANPKGPLYRWFGGQDRVNHEKDRALLALRLRDQEAERTSARLDRRPSQRFLASKRKP